MRRWTAYPSGSRPASCCCGAGRSTTPRRSGGWSPRTLSTCVRGYAVDGGGAEDPGRADRADSGLGGGLEGRRRRPPGRGSRRRSGGQLRDAPAHRRRRGRARLLDRSPPSPPGRRDSRSRWRSPTPHSGYRGWIGSRSITTSNNLASAGVPAGLGFEPVGQEPGDSRAPAASGVERMWRATGPVEPVG